MDDREILAKIRTKDPEGLTFLEETYGSFIRYVIRGILAGYPEDAEECLNDIRLKLWHTLPSYDPERSSLKTWLARITRNAALDRLKALKRRDCHFETRDPAKMPRCETTRSSSADPLGDALLLAEQRARLNEALNRLPARDLELFLRKYYYLQTANQIAAETGRSKRSVESRLARIKQQLALTLKEVR
ncbi:MAG: sigma-70 family RNA polymerase sigma factor [Lachnospiraceae bacterium]|nr:sigma-70 family RNA polymerase sigma factor [Lachnospiraceae bacterium]